MKKAVLALALIAAVALAVAQNAPQQPPKPGPEVQKLGYFAGNWKLEGSMKASPMGPAGNFSGTEHNEWMDGRFFVLMHTTETSSMGSAKGLAVLGYDPKRQVYTYHAFNSMGMAEEATGTVEGETWTWTSESDMGGKNVKGRFTEKVVSPTSFSFKFEMQDDSGQWSTIAEGTATRQAAAGKK